MSLNELRKLPDKYGERIVSRWGEVVLEHLAQTTPVDSGNLRNALLNSTAPRKDGNVWTVGIGDMSLVGVSPFDPPPPHTISAFLKWYARTAQGKREKQRKIEAGYKSRAERIATREKIEAKKAEEKRVRSFYASRTISSEAIITRLIRRRDILHTKIWGARGTAEKRGQWTIRSIEIEQGGYTEKRAGERMKIVNKWLGEYVAREQDIMAEMERLASRIERASKARMRYLESLRKALLGH